MKCTIIGATGYTGIELIRLLESHPSFEIICLMSDSMAGESMHDVFPFMNKKTYSSLSSFSVDHLMETETDMVFLATPSGISKHYLEQLQNWSGYVIDLSGDLRLPAEAYATWYDKEPIDAQLQQRATYGLPEWNRQAVTASKWIANPGCYATAVLLGLTPFLKEKKIDPSQIIIQASSGLTGAGKTLTAQTHHVHLSENVRLYKVNQHQHIPEIEQALFEWTGSSHPITFSTQLLPINRGIMAIMTVQPLIDLSETEWRSWLTDQYATEPFVRIQQADPEIKSVVGSNHCDLTVYKDDRTGRVTIVSVIDNMQKGAAGQAVQNANILAGFDETSGLTQQPIYI